MRMVAGGVDMYYHSGETTEEVQTPSREVEMSSVHAGAQLWPAVISSPGLAAGTPRKANDAVNSERVGLVRGICERLDDRGLRQHSRSLLGEPTAECRQDRPGML